MEACFDCDGEGTCTFCFGTGECHAAEHDDAPCVDCEGTNVCQQCGGNGDCPSCGGTGELD